MRANAPESILQDRLNALLWNQKIWQAFLVDLAEDDNALPPKLKASLRELGLWVVKETNLLIDDGGDFDALIAVNRNIMEGLRPSLSAAAE
jgi:flagellar protein FlaF